MIFDTVKRIADALERLSDLVETYLRSQDVRLPARRSLVSDDPPESSLTIYDPVREAEREHLANDLFINGNFGSWLDAYGQVLDEEKQDAR